MIKYHQNDKRHDMFIIVEMLAKQKHKQTGTLKFFRKTKNLLKVASVLCRRIKRENT